MSEVTRVWHPVRDRLGALGHLTRIESPTESGIPDVAYTIAGCSGWVENKLFEAEGRCPPHLTRQQVLWGEAEVRAGGRWFLLGRCRSDWLMYDVRGARALLEGGVSCPMFKTARFPTRELLIALAPPTHRRGDRT